MLMTIQQGNRGSIETIEYNKTLSTLTTDGKVESVLLKIVTEDMNVFRLTLTKAEVDTLSKQLTEALKVPSKL